MSALKIKPAGDCRWDCVALGEVMLRLDPGDGRVSTARSFRVWEGGGEYNVARGLKRCFGLNTAIVTALADNAVGRLVQDLIFQGGVDQSHLRWVEFDGVGRTVRNGLNFTERGFGMRAALGCSDRGHTAVSQLKSGDIDWKKIFKQEGARWFHCGGVFCGLSDTTPQVALEAIKAAKETGTIISYDLNYRDSLWKAHGGKKKAHEVNRAIAPYVDVMLGNEEDFGAALGFELPQQPRDGSYSNLNTASFKTLIQEVLSQYPNLSVVGMSLRVAKSASRNSWTALCYHESQFYEATKRDDLEIYDRVGGGDSFASGLIYGFLTGQDPQWAVECGAAHGALAMTTPGDTSMATREEVLQLMKGVSARIAR